MAGERLRHAVTLDTSEDTDNIVPKSDVGCKLKMGMEMMV